MAISIVVSDKVRFEVKVTINDAAGKAQPFKFWLTCHRLDSDALQARMQSDNAGVVFADFMAENIIDWSDVIDESRAPVPYSETSWRLLCKTPGLANVAFHTYLREVGAKEKN